MSEVEPIPKAKKRKRKKSQWGDEQYAEVRALALTLKAPDLKDTKRRLEERWSEIEKAA